MDMTIDQQVAMDEALVPHASRLRIAKSSFRLRSDITSKESTLQVVYDVLRLTLFYKAFLVTTDVPKIYMQEYWATITVHHHSIRFKMNNKKQEILAFLRNLGHSGEIKKITDVNINKLHQPWRSFAAVINMCLSEKSTCYDSLRLSQAQTICGMYHKKNVDFAYLLWEDFVYQVEHKDAKKSNEMYYPRLTKVIINFFMTKDPSIPRRNKVNLHYVRDDQMFTTIKLVSRHQNTQQFGSMLPVELTNEDIINSAAYKEYYAIASGAAPPKIKASVALTEAEQMKLATKRSLQQTHISQANRSCADEGTGIIPRVSDVPTYESDEEISWKSTDEDDDDVDDQSDADDDDQEDEGDDDQNDNDDDQDLNNDGDDFVHPKLSTHDEEAKEEKSLILLFKHHLTWKTQMMTPVMSSSVSSQFVSNMLNPSPDAGIDSLFESTPRVHVPVTTTVVPLPVTAPTLLSPYIPIISRFAEADSSIPGIVDRYIDHRMNEDVKVAVQLQSDRLRDEAQAENEDFLNKLDENIQKIIKEQVKDQVKVQVSKILPKIEKTVNEQLEAEVLTRASNLSKTSYDVAADLSELELKKILIKKMESNKPGVQEKTSSKKPESTSAPKEKTSKTSGKSTEGSKSHQKIPSESALAEEPMHTTLDEPSHQEFDKGVADDQPIAEASQHPDDLTKQDDSCTSFNELMDTFVDFLAFLMNRLKVDTLTPELLVGPTYELMKGSCKSLVELEFFLEEVYKATTDQLD
uniref:Retrovirus-related Pol polyprotein from transposon TNT 1-94 n=1 Tax=Tanacetum cinerariifolium TaxID=118510 RepID=A0A699HQQ6_TANCI|nr:hypothetical protein [Tanacetum cinerariifolium]